MKVLVGCEYSGRARDAFIAKGHNAMSCDLLPTEQPGPHHQGDVRDILYQDWDLIIAHPPCTYLANSGVRWLHSDKSRWGELDKAAEFFKLFLDHPCEKICIENPVMHKYAIERIGIKQTQTIQPYEHGEMETKRTGLWLKGLPEIQPTLNVKEEMLKLPYSERAKVHCTAPGPDRWKERSRTYLGIANAMANQWGST